MRGATTASQPARFLRQALLTVLATAASLLAPAASAQANAGGPYAVHSMLQLNAPYAFKQAMFSQAAALGASEIRVDVSLGALNNPYLTEAMWHGVDDYMQLSRQYDVPVLIDLNSDNTISLETCQPGANPAAGNCGVTDLTGYYNEIATLVRYTAGVINDFEVVNEPDGSWAFTGTPQQYAGMLATAYQAVHDNDPDGRVVLGGIMSPADAPWLEAVFTTPGFNAAHKFDVANVHLRDTLQNVVSQLVAWRNVFSFFGDGSLPIWVTETGYPSDPAYQYDPNFRGTDAGSGLFEQAAYLSRELPALVYAGASRVFVTERDDNILSGQYVSEGLFGGAVSDGDEAHPNLISKPAVGVFQTLAAQALAPAPAPAADPAPTATTPAPAAAVTPSAHVAVTRPAVAAHPATSTKHKKKKKRRPKRRHKPMPKRVARASRRPARIAANGAKAAQR